MIPFVIRLVGASPRTPSSAERAAALLRLPLTVRSIVVHPDLIGDPAPYRALGRRLVIENMDDRKTGGRTAGELAPLFRELPEAGFCLDIAHAHTVDPSMAAAAELLDDLGVPARIARASRDWLIDLAAS